MTTRCLFLLLLCCLALCTRAWAGGVQLAADTPSYQLNTVADVLEDPGGQLTLADVRGKQAGAFRPPDGGLSSFGFTHSAYWFRFELNNPTAQPRDMLLVLRTPWLDSIELYQPDEHGGYFRQLQGDTLPFAARPHPHPQFLMDMRIAPGRHSYYLRIASLQAFMNPFELWQPAAFHDSDRLWAGYFGMFYGVLLVMMLYNGFIWLSTRDRNYGYYCLYLVIFFLMNFSYSGFAYQYLWPDSPRWLTATYSSWIFLYQAVAIVFACHFLEARQRLPRLHRILRAYLVTVLLVWGGSLANDNRVLHNALAVYFIFVLTPLILLSGLAAWRHGYKAARFFTLAATATLIGAFVTALTVSGALPYSFASFHAAEFGITADVVLLALALADRINILREQKEAAEKNVIHEKLQSHARLEQAKLALEYTVQQRTAELARARDEAERLARIDVLTGVSNRRYFEEIASHEFARARRYQQPLALILFDIDLFKQINDSYGHAVGDAVLRDVADTSSQVVRDVDFVARIGGEEFAVLLPGVAATQAIASAERLRGEIAARQLDSNGQPVRFTASFGVAQLEDGDNSYQTLLQRADQMMYQSKRAGRNQVSPLL
ncbi:diguanylate cyclase [Vogesella sp. LIG4]|uniref:sensor domain-containing diguanylate cyclase n=1 Tax=Vogesella sp. LIG4 TaxID=1192162 RepID=UPI00081FFEC9|nr:diguanylate cyclase [Vogesella sp. LIG4]SCK11579.1 diguanylate cyclase (GGDEF) domain-containing protein [Vogesella sp. LIG4]